MAYTVALRCYATQITLIALISSLTWNYRNVYARTGACSMFVATNHSFEFSIFRSEWKTKHSKRHTRMLEWIGIRFVRGINWNVFIIEAQLCTYEWYHSSRSSIVGWNINLKRVEKHWAKIRLLVAWDATHCKSEKIWIWVVFKHA